MLLLPLIAMRFSDDVVWDVTDFAIFGAMLFGACGVYDLTTRMTGSGAYRAAIGIAVVAAFILIWINLAVGIIGSELDFAHFGVGGSDVDPEGRLVCDVIEGVIERHGRDPERA